MKDRIAILPDSLFVHLHALLAAVALIYAALAAGYHLDIVRYMFLMPAESEEGIGTSRPYSSRFASPSITSVVSRCCSSRLIVAIPSPFCGP